jgi:hypothetical protein
MQTQTRQTELDGTATCCIHINRVDINLPVTIHFDVERQTSPRKRCGRIGVNFEDASDGHVIGQCLSSLPFLFEHGGMCGLRCAQSCDCSSG